MPTNLRTFFIELTLYAVLVVAYFFIVLHEFGGWFKELYDHNRLLFAVMALVVMIGQAVGLELVSSALVWLFNRRGK